MSRHLARPKGLVISSAYLVLVVILGSAFFLTRSPGNVAAAATLGSAAAASGRFFGTSVQASLLSNTQYNSTLSTQFSSVTPENEMKWQTTEPSQNSFNFSSADQIVSFAQSHSMKIRGHTLVWHSQLPTWVSNLSGSSNVLAAMNNHITTEMRHFQGKIWYWDVVNEAFNDDGTRRSDVFQNQIGNNYIANAFTTARAADPNAKLCYNDFNIEGMNAKSNAVFSMVQSFKASGVPIDCVGFQSHLIVGQVPAGFQANLQRFANLGVDVQLTELDIRMPTPASNANLTQQANDYSTVVRACMAVSRCNDMTVWGVDDGHSWVPNTFSGQGAALLFDASFQPKPAFNSVITALGGASATPTPTAPAGTNLLTNADTEAGTTGWAVFGSGSLSSNTSVFHGGTHSLLLTGRTAAWNGISQNVTSKLTNGKSYISSVWVRTQSGAPSAKVTLALTVNGTTSFVALTPSAAVNTSGWTLLSGTATVSWSGTLSNAVWYVETVSGTDNLLADDASFH
ncbi:MAG TPA: endo-1,4-beta-xylanase [Ktedonobacteraceae bacterium]|nr:endo-1,4-beta-xylanase [Ktedonobacteraceae bacterium]